MSNFAVLRVAKIRTLKGVSGASCHNNRTADRGLGHAEGRNPKMGGGVMLIAGRDDAVSAWHERTSRVGMSRPRKDAVRALEVVMSASPAWFEQASSNEREAWKKCSLEWAFQKFGEDNILSAHLHDDEDTPHLHLLIVPLVQKMRKAAGRPRKGRPPRKATASWGLSAAEFIGGPERLVEMQTDYAAAVSDLGIQRGRPRRATGAQHVSAASYRGQTADELQEAREAHSKALKALDMARATQEDVAADNQRTADALTLGINALDNGELSYRPAAKARKERLVWKKVETPVLPTSAPELKAWKAATRPFFDLLMIYARRISKVALREQEVDARGKALTIREKSLNQDAAAVASLLVWAKKPTEEIEEIRERRRQRVK